MLEVFIKSIIFYAPSNGYTLLLQEGENATRQLPVMVGQFEAQAIALAMENIDLPRPMTHDLLSNVIDTLTLGLESVVISDLRDGTFYANLLVRRPQGLEEIDARPSDAIAIAIRTKTPIFVEDWIMTEAGVTIEPKGADHSEESDRELLSRMDKLTSVAKKRYDLEEKLANAIRDEDYELAAVIRDQLRELSHN
ncbi:MAG: bifunctional nuclease family protein [Candidatus Marinimicrobia bacterium]|nr:bifunctional nuclease family protein [Candidatus Neomarinimicrobiota bacterium]MCF7839408.1 bifunctional nuclease family protein [Candidatus Neomarinimicrobiota bacterium]